MRTLDVPNGEYSSGSAAAADLRAPTPLSELRIPKNRSTGNLLVHSADAYAGARARRSFHADAFLPPDDAPARFPIMPEHEHGLGASGLRRIRQRATFRHPTLPSALTPSATAAPASPASSAVTAVSLPSSRVTSQSSTVPSTPALAAGDDLCRFPAESLHSFSFTQQAEEPLHSRQNILRRSIEFLRDRPGWIANNAGIVSAQARLTGDVEAQSVLELLARAKLLGPDDEATAAHGPLTGPAEAEGINPFEKLFIPRSASPDELDRRKRPASAFSAAAYEDDSEPASPTTLRHPVLPGATAGFDRRKDSAALGSGSRSPIASSRMANDAAARKPTLTVARAGLKRTSTDLAPLSIEDKLIDTLAVPYIATDSAHAAPQPQPLMPSSAGPVAQPTSALHAHSSRWAPAAQAIFTTQASRPWTIQAANDLACLVFGLTKADIGKLGILEVVREERRAWLEERLRSPGSDSPAKQRAPERANQRSAPKSAVSPAFGNGVTAQLLSKPAWRDRRAQTAGARGGQKPAKKDDAGESHHVNNRSRGVLLCGDVVPIQKRNGATGAASLWVKEKRGGLIWVLEEIIEDVAYLDLDDGGNVVSESGATAAIWGFEKGVKGLNIGRLVPHVPRCLDALTGSVDVAAVTRLKQFAVCTVADAYVPATVEIVPHQRGLRISTIPHIAGMMVISASTLQITSSNTVFSAALFGRPQPDGLAIADLIPDFDKVLRLLFEDNAYELVDGLVIPEHSFRRARALLAIREGWPDAAMALLQPNGLPAKHRDGSEIKVDVQMRVVKGNMRNHDATEAVIKEVAEEEDEAQQADAQENGSAGVLYALWITYSRHIHGVGPQLASASATASLAKPETPPHQPSPGQTQRPLSPPDMTPEEPVGDGTPDDMPASPTEQTPPSAVDLLRAVAEANKPATARTNAANGTAKTPPAPPAKPAKPAKPAEAAGPMMAAVAAMKGKKKKTIDDFVILEDMGQGAYGQVKLARYKRDAARKMVLKYVTKRRILVDTWTRDRRLGTVPLEIHVLDYLRRDGLRHPNIVEMADFFEDEVNYYIEMVPHGLPGMDLFDYIELRVNMDEAECRSIFRQVANAVHHLHARALVVHRDIKDENVILDGEGNIKLIDFGSASYIKNGPFDVFVGTIDYAAPEVLAGHPYGGKEQDVWALGILLYTIVYKENPFYSIDEIMDHGLRVPFVLSEPCIDLIRLMLTRDVDRRITIAEVLQHPWLQQQQQQQQQQG